MTGSGVNHDAGLLVENDQIGVFIQNVQFDRLGFDPQGFRRGNSTFDPISGANPVTGLFDAAVDSDFFVVNEMSRQGSGTFIDSGCNQGIESLAGFRRFDIDAEGPQGGHDA
jgi:hypothetical protein